jgi:hypothetical protein
MMKDENQLFVNVEEKVTKKDLHPENNAAMIFESISPFEMDIVKVNCYPEVGDALEKECTAIKKEHAQLNAFLEKLKTKRRNWK